MRRVLVLGVISALSLAGVRAGFAVGGNVGGLGDNSVKVGGTGIVGDSAGILSRTEGLHTGGVGPVSHVSSPQATNAPTDNNFRSTGAKGGSAGGKGSPKPTAGGINQPGINKQGTNAGTETPGGRGF